MISLGVGKKGMDIWDIIGNTIKVRLEPKEREKEEVALITTFVEQEVMSKES